MNRRDFSAITQAFPDIIQSNTGPTRQNMKLDLIATNIEPSLKSSKIFAALETEDDKRSDHDIMCSTYVLSKRAHVEWIKYQARERTDEGRLRFSKLLASQDWAKLLQNKNSSEMASELGRVTDDLMNECFPIRTYRAKANDPPWITHGIRKRIDPRLEVFKTDQKRSARWRKTKSLTDRLIEKAQRLINLEIPVLVRSLKSSNVELI